MSAQKTLSQLSVAAVALLVVSLPCFAQTDNLAKTEKDNDAVSTVGSTSGATVSINVDRLASPFEIKSEVKSEDNRKPAPKFSAAQFMQAAEQSPAVTIKSSSAFQLVPAPTTRTNTWKGITFAPSRGQKYPWQTL